MWLAADKKSETTPVGTNGQTDSATNLTYTKFIFVLPHDHDAATLAKIRSAGSHVSRGFFNDYDADGSREMPQETIHFLTCESAPPGRHEISAARFVVQVSGNYRPRLVEVACDFKRRLGDAADVIMLDGAERMPRYTSAEMRDVRVQAGAQQADGPCGDQRDHPAHEQDGGVVGEVRTRAPLGTSIPIMKTRPGPPSKATHRPPRPASRKCFAASTTIPTDTSARTSSTSSPTSNAPTRICRCSITSAGR